MYCCGMSKNDRLPKNSSEVSHSKRATQKLLTRLKMIVSQIKDSQLKTEQACFLPLTEDGLPVIGQVPGITGAFISAGHSCWGILNAPGTGLVMADLIKCHVVIFLLKDFFS